MQLTEFTEKYFANLNRNQGKIPLFYQFLQISPSYRAAHMHVEHGESEPNQYDFNRVLITYRDFGDVWANDYQTWWANSAHKKFDLTKKPEPETIFKLNTITAREFNDIDTPYLNLITRNDDSMYEYLTEKHLENGFPNLAVIAVPLDGEQAEIEANVIKLLRAEWAKTNVKKATSKYRFIKNKIRSLTLEKCIYSVHQRALNLDDGDRSLLTLGDQITEKFEHSEHRGSLVTTSGASLRSQTSNMLAKTLNIAENAARGEFPKSAKNRRFGTAGINGQIAYHLNFDYGFIADEIKNERMVTSAEKHTEENTAKKHNKIT